MFTSFKHLKVFKITTCSIFADVVYFIPIWYLTVCLFPNIAMIHNQRGSALPIMWAVVSEITICI